jgi:hypothetical protein
MNGHTVSHHDVCWGAIIAGAAVAAAASLLLLEIGVGGGLAAVSPWEGEGLSSTTASIGAAVFIIATSIIASGLGGYITGRMRNAWEDVHEHERFFRDTAHGLVTWAVAAVVGATILAGAATHLVSAAATGSIPAAGAAASQASSGPGDIYVDTLLRGDPARAAANQADPKATRDELTRIIAPATRKGGEVAATDRAYAARIVSARTGLSQAEAEQRVNPTIAQAKEATDKARKAASRMALLMAIAMLAGALSAMFGAVEGGKLRSSRWYEAVRVTVVQ